MNNYHIILLVTEEQEKAIIGLFAARRWMYMKAGTCSSTNHIDFKGNENNAVPVETVHTCRQSCCDDISSDKRYESSSEDSLKVGKQNDMTNKNDREQGHKNSSDTKYNAFLSGSLSFRHNSEIMGNSGIEDEKSFLKDTLEMEIEDFKKSKSVPILPRFNNSISSLFRVVKNISDPDAADQNTPWSETYDSTFTSAQKELIAGDINDKFDGRLNDTHEPNETCKQDYKETESGKQQPERSESCIQDSGRIETCKEESDETNSPKRQHGMSKSCTQDLDEIKLIKPPERSDSSIQELGQKTNCGHKLEKIKPHEKQESKVGISSFLNIHQNVDISHSSVLSLLRARINSKIQQDIDRQETNDRKSIDATATQESNGAKSFGTTATQETNMVKSFNTMATKETNVVNSFDTTATKETNVEESIGARATKETNVVESNVTTATHETNVVKGFGTTATQETSMVKSFNIIATKETNVLNSFDTTATQETNVEESIGARATKETNVEESNSTTATQETNVVKSFNTTASQETNMVKSFDTIATKETNVVKGFGTTATQETNVVKSFNTTASQETNMVKSFDTIATKEINVVSSFDSTATQETNVEESIDATATMKPEIKSTIDKIAGLKKGQKANNSALKDIYCKDCKHTFRQQKSNDKNLRHGKCQNECEICGKIFKYSMTDYYKWHIKSHMKQRDEECKICGKFFTGRRNLLKHLKKHTEVGKPIICEICGLGVKNKDCLISHKKNKHDEKRESLLCPKCPKRYMSYNGLTYHLRKSHDEGNKHMFYCDICNKKFPGINFLKAHIVSHIGTRDFKCDTCAAAFKTISELNSHRKRHNNIFSLFCQYCGKGFRKNESQKLRDHENTHSGVKPYLCTFCDYKCACISNLIKHKKLVHKK